MNYLKAIASAAVSAVAAVITALGTGNTDFSDIDTKSWLLAAVAVLGSGGIVWLTDNGPAAPAIKAVMAFLSAGIGSAIISLDDDVFTRAEQLTAFVAAVSATGIVFQVKNRKKNRAAAQPY